MSSSVASSGSAPRTKSSLSMLAQNAAIPPPIAPPSTGEHVYTVHITSHLGKYLSIDSNNAIVHKEAPGAHETFELHCFPPSSTHHHQASPSTSSPHFSASSPTTSSSSSFSPSSIPVSSPSADSLYSACWAPTISIRAPHGKFMNVDDAIELITATKPPKEKDILVRCDRDLRDDGRDRFILHREKDDNTFSIRHVDGHLLSVDGDGKLRLVPAASIVNSHALFNCTFLNNRSPIGLRGLLLMITCHSRYVCVEPSGRVLANRCEAVLWEQLQLVPLDAKHVAFYTVHAKYVTTHANGEVNALTDQITPNAIFTVIELPTTSPLPDRFAFQSASGHYLTAEGNFNIVANRRTIGPWQTFQIIPTLSLVPDVNS